jgi:hypothetical protein
MTAYVVCWSEFLATDPEVLGSIPGASRFSEKQWVWNGVHSALWGQLRSYLEEIVAAPVKKTKTNDWGDPLRWARDTLYPQKLALLRQEAAVARSAYYASRQKPRFFLNCVHDTIWSGNLVSKWTLIAT